MHPDSKHKQTYAWMLHTFSLKLLKMAHIHFRCTNYVHCMRIGKSTDTRLRERNRRELYRKSLNETLFFRSCVCLSRCLFCFFIGWTRQRRRRRRRTIVTPTPFNYFIYVFIIVSSLCNYITAFSFSVFDISWRYCAVVPSFLSTFFAFFRNLSIVSLFRFLFSLFFFLL